MPTASLCHVSLIAVSPEMEKGSFRGLDENFFNLFSLEGLLLCPITRGLVALWVRFPISEPPNYQDLYCSVPRRQFVWMTRLVSKVHECTHPRGKAAHAGEAEERTDVTRQSWGSSFSTPGHVTTCKRRGLFEPPFLIYKREAMIYQGLQDRMRYIKEAAGIVLGPVGIENPSFSPSLSRFPWRPLSI